MSFNPSREPTEVGEYEVLQMTEAALLVRPSGGGEKIWIPKSQLPDSSSDGNQIWRESERGDIAELIIPEWLAKKYGLA